MISKAMPVLHYFHKSEGKAALAAGGSHIALASLTI
jgi:hypothetical protein